LESLAKTDFCDSPVRKNADIIAYERNFIDKIQHEVQQLREQAGNRGKIGGAAVFFVSPARWFLIHSVDGEASQP
jgi:hypothetical protein